MTQDMARPAGPGSHASHEASKLSSPSGFDPSRDELWVVSVMMSKFSGGCAGRTMVMSWRVGCDRAAAIGSAIEFALEAKPGFSVDTYLVQGFTASAIEARSDGTGTGPAEGESAVPKGDAHD